MKTNEIRTNTFFLSSYCSKDFIKEVLERKLSQVKSYAFILHDKDVYLNDVFDNEHNIIHRKGELEIPHVHIYIELYYSRLPREIISWFKCLDEENRPINTFKEIPYVKQSCIDYLTHKWDKEKYQYSYEEVVSFGLKKLDDGSLQVNDDTDLTYDIISDLLNGTGLKTIIKRYGKDFVYHYKQYKELVVDLLDFKRYGRDFRSADTQYTCDEDGDLPF